MAFTYLISAPTTPRPSSTSAAPLDKRCALGLCECAAVRGELRQPHVRHRALQPVAEMGGKQRLVPLLARRLDVLGLAVVPMRSAQRKQRYRCWRPAGPLTASALRQHHHRPGAGILHAHQRPVAPRQTELLARHAGRHPEDAPPRMQPHAKAAEHPVTQDASVGRCVPKQQRLGDQYNRHQLSPGKTRTKTSCGARKSARMCKRPGPSR